MNNVLEKFAAIVIVGIFGMTAWMCVQEYHKVNSTPRTTFESVGFQTEINTNLVGATIGEGLLLHTNVLSATPILEALPWLVNAIIDQNPNIVRSTSNNVWVVPSGTTLIITN